MKRATVTVTILAFFALVVMVVFAVAGCGRSTEEEVQTPDSNVQAEEHAQSEEPAEAHGEHAVADDSADADVLLCLVSGEKFTDASKSASKSVYKGKTYYFCCADCKPKFDADPEKYISGEGSGEDHH